MDEIKCNLCNSDDHKLLFKNKDRLHKVDNKQFNIVKCNNCNLVFVNPQPSQRELEKYYPNSYGNFQDEDAVFKYGPITKTLKKFFKKTSRNDLDNSVPAVKQEDAVINYLDFGCGSGSHLEKIRHEHPSWNLYGLDVSELACKKAKDKGFEVFCGDVTEIDLLQDHYDKVNMTYVIEHLNDPRHSLQEINKAMKIGSQIRIATPNINSIEAKMFKKYWFSIDSPRHLFLFSQHTLTELLKLTGFKVEKVIFDKSPKDIIRSLYYFIKKKDIKINPFIWRFFIPINKIFYIFGQPSVMIVEANKIFKKTSV